MASSFFYVLLSFLSCTVPAIGIVLTARGRRTHGRAAVIGMLGCVALLLDGLLRLAQALLINTIAESIGISRVGIVLMVVGLLSFVFATTGVGLLIWAAVARRTPQPQPDPLQGWQQPGRPQQPPAGPYQNPQQGWHQPPS